MDFTKPYGDFRNPLTPWSPFHEVYFPDNHEQQQTETGTVQHEECDDKCMQAGGTFFGGLIILFVLMSVWAWWTTR